MKRVLSSMAVILSLGLGTVAGAQTLATPEPALAEQPVGVSVQPFFSKAFYSNTAPSSPPSSYFSYRPGANINIIDDIGFQGLYLVDGFQFAYRTSTSAKGTASASFNFYDADSKTGLPVLSSPVASFVLNGLPAVQNGAHTFLFNVNLPKSQQFLWSDKGNGFGWLGQSWSSASFGPLIAEGGPSADLFYQNPPGGLFFFGGNPAASFYLQVYGTAVPEPGSLALLLAGGSALIGLAARRRRK